MALNKKFFTTGGIVASSPTEGALDPLQNFETVTYTGNGSTQSITSLDFQPDLVWIKQRSAAGNHSIFDSVRGVQKYLLSNSTVQETDYSGDNGVTSFDSNGFTVDDTGGIDYSVNHSGTYVSWCWKAGGAAVSNTDGTITSQVSANQAAGFSIVKYTGNATNGATIGHGLSSAPELIIIKNLIDAENWSVYSSPTGNTQVGHINLTNAFSATGDWNNTTPTTSVFTVGTSNRVNTTDNFIAYCFHSVDGYQKIGSYTPTTGDDVVTLGFRPRFVMLKRATGGTGNWEIHDGTRYPSIYTDTGESRRLRANTPDAEAQFTDSPINFTDTGFVLDSSVTGDSYGDYDANGSTYIYLAIA